MHDSDDDVSKGVTEEQSISWMTSACNWVVSWVYNDSHYIERRFSFSCSFSCLFADSDW